MGKKVAYVLSGISVLTFLCAAFFSGIYFLEYLTFYDLYSPETVRDSVIWAAVLVVSLALLVSLIVFACRTNKKIVPSVLLLLFSIVFSFSALFSLLASSFDPNGCSYTEDIAHYENHGGEISYFPDEISDDMEVVDYCYWYKYSDCSHGETYLEVKFENRQIMEEHIREAIEGFGENGIKTYKNPYNPSYTDIIGNNNRLLSSEGSLAGFIAFKTSDDTDHRYIDASYNAVTYSYDELTVIYISLFIGSDIGIEEYYPKYLRRFGIEHNMDNTFYVQYEEETTENITQ